MTDDLDFYPHFHTLLQNIFFGEDFRKQLPRESKEFDEINSSWKTIMDCLNKDRNALRGTHHPGMSGEIRRTYHWGRWGGHLLHTHLYGSAVHLRDCQIIK